MENKSTIFTDNFFSKISHNSRSPFNGLLGFSELFLLNQKKISPESITEYLLKINMLAKRTFISSENNILFLKIYSNKIVPLKTNSSFLTIFSQSFSLNKEAFEIKKVTLENQVKIDFSLNCDSFLTTSILTNIISKAIQLCDDQSRITITSKSEDSNCNISIEYSGLNIESEVVRKFFTHQNKKQDLFAPELDIELWICYQLAKLQNIQFQISFHSKNTTIFTIKT